MRKLLTIGLVAATTAILATTAHAAVRMYQANITHDQEVGVPDEGTSGFGTFVLNDDNPASPFLTYDVTLLGLDLDGLQTPADANDNVTRTHFHAAAFGVNGGIVFGQIDPSAGATKRLGRPRCRPGRRHDQGHLGQRGRQRDDAPGPNASRSLQPRRQQSHVDLLQRPHHRSWRRRSSRAAHVRARAGHDCTVRARRDIRRRPTKKIVDAVRVHGWHARSSSRRAWWLTGNDNHALRWNLTDVPPAGTW